MNFLAHLALSGGSAQIMTGNFIGDHVKGNSFKNFPEKISKGIVMHRFIDNYTDHHPLFLQGKKRLGNDYGKYSGVVVDIFYDHFLSLNWDKFYTLPLNHFISASYLALLSNIYYLPPGILAFLPHLILFDRLNTYKQITGIEYVLKKMSARYGLPEKSEIATGILVRDYALFNSEFLIFYQDLRSELGKNFEMTG